jgi:hypothetical protein
MQPENLRFGGGATETILHPLVLIALLLAILFIFVLPRKYLIFPVMSMFFLIPLGQQALIGGLHFYVARLVILAVAVRILGVAFFSPDGLLGRSRDVLDILFLCWAFFRAAAGILTFMESGAVIYQTGFLLDVIGGYFVFRFLLHDKEDILRTIRFLAVIVVVLSGFMIYEKLTVVNLFGFLGGVREAPEVRDGVVRAVGPFQHELLAGVFGATSLPLFYLLWKNGQSRVLAILGAIGSTVMTATSASSTSLLAYAAALVAIGMFSLRRMMRLVRWGIVAGIILLDIVMKAPVWFVISRVNILGSSSGYHRAMLVNDFIVHFSDWWLIGTKENHTWGFSMWDLCNQFVAEGELGGLATFICFVALIVIGFSRIGRARKAVEGNRASEWYFWLLGCTLFAHVIAFNGVSYFDQTRFLWFAFLAMIVVATAPYRSTEAVPRRLLPFRAGGPKLAYGGLAMSSPSAKMINDVRRPAFKTQFS